MASILEGFDGTKAATFKKEWNELERILALLRAEGVKKSPDFEPLMEKTKRIIKLWNKKYKTCYLELCIPSFLLNTFIKIKTVKEAFLTAAKIDGLSSLGKEGFGRVRLTETERVAREIEEIRESVFLTFGEKSPIFHLSLKKRKKGVAADGDNEGFDRPRVQLIAYYALHGKTEKINLLPDMQGIGRASTPTLEEEREFYQRLNPKMDSI